MFTLAVAVSLLPLERIAEWLHAASGAGERVVFAVLAEHATINQDGWGLDLRGAGRVAFAGNESRVTFSLAACVQFTHEEIKDMPYTFVFEVSRPNGPIIGSELSGFRLARHSADWLPIQGLVVQTITFVGAAGPYIVRLSGENGEVWAELDLRVGSLESSPGAGPGWGE